MTLYRLKHTSGIYHGSGLFGVAICAPYTWTDRRMARIWQRHLLVAGMKTRLETYTPETIEREGAD